MIIKSDKHVGNGNLCTHTFGGSETGTAAVAVIEVPQNRTCTHKILKSEISACLLAC